MAAQVRFLTVFLAAVFFLSVQVQRTYAVQDDDAAQALAVALNDWRVAQGVWPLRLNPTLSAMAVDQANYVLSLPEIPAGGAIHNGRSGEDPKTRARGEAYNWPFYDIPEETAVTEIAYVGRSPEAAVAYWSGSHVHNRAALNPTYREVGMAALSHPFGHMYIVVLGARPNVLTAIASESSNVLFLSNETTDRPTGDWLVTATEFRLFDAEGRPVKVGWQAWQPTVELPADISDPFYIEFSDGTTQVLTQVDLDAKLVSAIVPPPEPAPIITTTPVPPATDIPVPAVAQQTVPQPPVEPQSDAPEPPKEDAVIVGQTQPANTALVYDDRSLALLNLTSGAINVQNVSLAGPSLTFAVTRWQTEWLSGTLDALAGSDCLQVWSWQEEGQLPMPEGCRQRRGVITVAPAQMFWLEGDFTVMNNGQAIAVCLRAARRCDFAV